MSPYTAPRPLAASDSTGHFRSGEEPLDTYLRERAFKNHQAGAARCFVTLDEANQIAGYYTLSSGSVAHSQTPGKVRRNMPDPVPALLMGRLAVDAKHQGQGLGANLGYDAISRCASVAQNAGVRVLFVHALSESARQFYLRYDFVESPHDSMMLMLLLKDLGLA